MALKNSESDIKESKSVKAINRTATKEKRNTKKGYVYIGPTLPNGALKANTVFTGTLADTEIYLKDVIETYPLVKHLIVSLEELPEQRVKAKAPGNYINQCYKNVIMNVNKQ